MDARTLVIFDGMNHLCSFASFDTDSMVEAAFQDAMSSLTFVDPEFGTPQSRCRCVFVWDPLRQSRSGGGNSSFRHTALPAYKANRRTKSSVIVHAVENRDLFCARLAEAGIPSVTQPGLEADDYISFIARLVRPAESIIVSQDADFLHLVCPTTSILRNQGWLDLRSFEREIGLSPERHLAWKALAGDPSDNVPQIRDSARSWAWAVAGAQVSDLSDAELVAYNRNLSIIHLELWRRRGAVCTKVWREAKRRFFAAMEPAN